MDRITLTDVDRIAATISESLNDLRVEIGVRNGYFGVDMYDRHGQVDTLHIGTKREIYTYMQGMRRALLITGR